MNPLRSHFIAIVVKETFLIEFHFNRISRITHSPDVVRLTQMELMAPVGFLENAETLIMLYRHRKSKV